MAANAGVKQDGAKDWDGCVGPKNGGTFSIGHGISSLDLERYLQKTRTMFLKMKS